MNAKQWLRDNFKVYLKVIKEWVRSHVATEVDSAKDELREEFGNITGTYKGAFETVSAMPSAAKNGQWSVLRVDDGSNESGIYVKQASGWGFVCDITTFDEAKLLLASDAEFSTGTAVDKAVTVKQVTDAFGGTVTDAEAKADWGGV